MVDLFVYQELRPTWTDDTRPLRTCDLYRDSGWKRLIGRDNGEVVDARYEKQAPFAFTGTIHKVTYDIRPPSKPDHETLHKAQAAGAQARHIEA